MHVLEAAALDQFRSFHEMRRGPVLGAREEDSLRRGGSLDHRLAFEDVVSQRLLYVDVLSRPDRINSGQGMPVIGRGDVDRVDVPVVNSPPVVLANLASSARQSFARRLSLTVPYTSQK